MPAATHPEFNEKTDALEAAKAFPEQILGKCVLVTGVNRQGIGFTTAQAFASQSPRHLILASRTPEKIQECIDALKTDYPNVDYRALELDLSSQKAVRTAAAELLSWTDIPSIDIIVNNAAVANLPERQLSKDGIEMHFATNHIGHFLFTCLVMPKLLKAAEGSPKGATRVVNVSSLSPTVAGIRWSDINFDKTNKTLPQDEQPSYDTLKAWGVENSEELSYVPIEGYNQSKAANVLFSVALNKRLFEKYGILSFAAHPGVIWTELSRYASPEAAAATEKLMRSGRFHIKSLGEGSSTNIVAAADPGLGEPVSKTDDGIENYGVYFIDCQISGAASLRASSSQNAERLWKLSEELVKESFSW